MSEKPLVPAPDSRPPPSAPQGSDPPRGGPDSFQRIFLEGLEKYQTSASRQVGSDAEEAAANIAQRTKPSRALGGLELRSPRAIVETLVITTAIPALGWAVDANDPFFVKHHFAWLCFAPLLVSLRHGFTLG